MTDHQDVPVPDVGHGIQLSNNILGLYRNRYSNSMKRSKKEKFYDTVTKVNYFHPYFEVVKYQVRLVIHVPGHKLLICEVGIFFNLRVLRTTKPQKH